MPPKLIVKRNDEEFREWLNKKNVEAAARLEQLGLNPETALSSEWGWLITLPKYEGRLLEFDAFQSRFLTTTANRRSVLKARQIGFSFEIACESIARCHIKPKHVAVCVSYNLDDAKEKISLVKELWEELPLEFQKSMVIDSKTEVGFASNDRKRRIAKVISYPSKAPRGKTGDVYLDELAHCQNDRQIYAGATALIARSGGQLTIGSTPLGRRGIFHAIHTQEFEKFPGYWRQEIPWWLCRYFCSDVSRAVREAMTMTTEQRVEMFGTETLRDQFDALPIEDFQQEFELIFQDERVSFFPYELILPCCQREAHEIPTFGDIDSFALKAPDLGPLKAGFDVGRFRHPSELYVFELKDGVFVERFNEQYKDMPFPKQRERLKHVIQMLGSNLREFRIDCSGLGRNLAEDLQAKFGRRIIPVEFTRISKSEIAHNLKILFQEKAIVLAKSRDVVTQIHSIKQKITSAGNTIFDAERNRHHHADKMWAIGMACYRKRERKSTVPEVGSRVLGEEREKEGQSKVAEGAAVPNRQGMTALEQAVNPPVTTSVSDYPVLPHYFDQVSASPYDLKLQLAIKQGYVPKTCLLGGDTALGLALKGRDPCIGCEGPRSRCRGRKISDKLENKSSKLTRLVKSLETSIAVFERHGDSAEAERLRAKLARVRAQLG